jgi:hypothetical protein
MGTLLPAATACRHGFKSIVRAGGARTGEFGSSIGVQVSQLADLSELAEAAMTKEKSAHADHLTASLLEQVPSQSSAPRPAVVPGVLTAVGVTQRCSCISCLLHP